MFFADLNGSQIDFTSDGMDFGAIERSMLGVQPGYSKPTKVEYLDRGKTTAELADEAAEEMKKILEWKALGDISALYKGKAGKNRAVKQI